MAESNVPGTIIGAYAVTKGDADQARPFQRLWVGGTGHVTVRTLSGQNVEFRNVPVGWLDVAGTQVRDATTATLIVAVY
jgi:hypothetical protein